MTRGDYTLNRNVRKIIDTTASAGMIHEIESKNTGLLFVIW